MRVCIVGGGIGGTALATFLARQGIEVVLIDKAAQWKNVGFGLTLWGNGRKILRELGIDEKLVAYSYEIPFIRSYSILGKKTWQDLYFSNFKNFGGPVLIVPRAALHELLIGAIPATVNVRLGEKIKKIDQYESYAEVEFEDGMREKFDLVVGADGVSSHIRELLFGKNLSSSGWSFWLFWVPADAPLEPYAFSVSISDQPVAMGYWPLKDRGFIGIGQMSKIGGKKNRKRCLNFLSRFYKRKDGAKSIFQKP